MNPEPVNVYKNRYASKQRSCWGDVNPLEIEYNLALAGFRYPRLRVSLNSKNKEKGRVEGLATGVGPNYGIDISGKMFQKEMFLSLKLPFLTPKSSL